MRSSRGPHAEVLAERSSTSSCSLQFAWVVSMACGVGSDPACSCQVERSGANLRGANLGAKLPSSLSVLLNVGMKYCLICCC